MHAGFLLLRTVDQRNSGDKSCNTSRNGRTWWIRLINFIGREIGDYGKKMCGANEVCQRLACDNVRKPSESDSVITPLRNNSVELKDPGCLYSRTKTPRC